MSEQEKAQLQAIVKELFARRAVVDQLCIDATVELLAVYQNHFGFDDAHTFISDVNDAKNMLLRSRTRARRKQQLRAYGKTTRQDKYVEEYIKEAEHQDGDEYWDNFNSRQDVIDDFELYMTNLRRQDNNP